ncbi:MAG: hypothetical protein JKY81_03250 [Colwellia sp.]|nr:hypothetical protein [Colwellia sp.]
MKDEKKYLFDDPKNIKRVLHILYACCILLFLLDFVINRHIYHSWENLWGFYPIYGFVGCVLLVIVATWMRTFLMRDEDYYDKPQSTELNDNKGASHVDD